MTEKTQSLFQEEYNLTPDAKHEQEKELRDVKKLTYEGITAFWKQYEDLATKITTDTLISSIGDILKEAGGIIRKGATTEEVKIAVENGTLSSHFNYEDPEPWVGRELQKVVSFKPSANGNGKKSH
jgi:hypothetical protein